MKSLFTLARKHGSETWDVAVGPDALPSAHRRFVKSMRASRTNHEYAEVQTLRPVRRFKFGRTAGAPKQNHPATPPAQNLIQKAIAAVKPKAKAGRKPKGAFAMRVSAAAANKAD